MILNILHYVINVFALCTFFLHHSCFYFYEFIQQNLLFGNPDYRVNYYVNILPQITSSRQDTNDMKYEFTEIYSYIIKQVLNVLINLILAQYGE